MARPRTYKEEARNHTITVRVTGGTHAKLTAEAAQAGRSLAGLAEHYISRGTLRIDAADNQMSPSLLAELKRIAAELSRINDKAQSAMPPKSAEVATALRDLLQVIVSDELLSQRVHAAKPRMSANDSAPASPRHEFQRVVQIHSPRPRPSEDV
jgi:hypothetical protein